MSAEEHRQVRNIIRWNRIGCIVVKMSERFHISLTDALDIFYRAIPVGVFMTRRLVCTFTGIITLLKN